MDHQRDGFDVNDVELLGVGPARRQRTHAQLQQSAPHAALLMNGGGSGGGGTTWNPADKGLSVTLSNGNLTAIASGSSQPVVRCTTAHDTTGKFYFEVVVDVIAGFYPSVGVCDASNPLSNGMQYGNLANYWCMGLTPTYAYCINKGASYVATGVNFVVGDIAQVAVDFATSRIWFGRNNTFILSGNPGANTNPTFTNIAGTLFAVTNVSNSSKVTAKFASGSLSYSPPSGFSPW